MGWQRTRAVAVDRPRVPQDKITRIGTKEVEACSLAKEPIAVRDDEEVPLLVSRRVAAREGLVALVRAGDDAEAPRVFVGRRELHEPLHAYAA